MKRPKAKWIHTRPSKAMLTAVSVSLVMSSIAPHWAFAQKPNPCVDDFALVNPDPLAGKKLVLKETVASELSARSLPTTVYERAAKQRDLFEALRKSALFKNTS